MRAKEYGAPGEWAKLKGTIVSIWPIFLCSAMVGAFLTAMIMSKYMLVFFCLLMAVVVATVILWNRGLHKVKSYFIGAVGEARVAGELRKLPDGYYVFHDFPVGSVSFVDHVVIGPTGVFSIETKDWFGEVSIKEGHILRNGDIPPFSSPIKQAKEEARKVEKVLRKKGWSGSVTSVLCYASNNFADGLAETENVKVVNANKAAELITSMTTNISSDGVERIVKLIGV